jgi:hypothetical protein
MSGTRWIHTTLLVLACLLLVGAVWAGSSANYAMDWQVLSGGGAPALSGSGQVALSGTLGQTAIGHSPASHAALGAGFWYGVGKGVYEVYLPLVLRSF